MPSQFCISVIFHDARFHGQRDGGEPEWPPSPLRLYQAMVAAFAARGSLDEARTALLWLEQQDEPIILAPASFQPKPYRIAVPNNDMDVPAKYWAKGQDAPKYKNPQDLKSMKTVCPIHLDGGNTLHFLYPLPEPLSADVLKHIELLASAAPSVTHLGWGIDMVAGHARILAGDEASKLPGQRWKPVSTGGVPLRVPQSGILGALVLRHDAFLARVTEDGFTPVPPLVGFKTVAYDNVDRINLRHCAAFELIPADLSDRRRFRAFRQELIVHVAAMLRHAACEAVMNDLDEGGWRTKKKAEEFVAGHGLRKAAESFSRFSYLPLPNVPLPAQPHADGMIRRVLIAETPGMDGRWAAWGQQRLAGLALRDEKSKREVALLRPALNEDSIFRTFTREADRWQTITPIILPGFDSRQFAKRDKLIIKCFAQAGLPLKLIADFEVQRSPWLRASAQTRSYKRSVHLDHLPAWHLRIYFKRAIAGPVAIGAGRHCGMGLLTQMF